MNKRNKKIADEVRQRDGCCVVCGRPEVDVHHVKTWGAHGQDDPRFMVALCRVCHRWWHEGKPGIRLRVEQHLARVSQPNWVADYPFGFPLPDDLQTGEK